jgi:uncharacterized protein YegP (UPF0339 family)
MNEQRAMLETQKAHHEDRLRGLKSYVHELTEMCAKNGTDESAVHADLTKAKCDIEFHEGQCASIADALGDAISGAAFHVYKDDAGEWRWNLKATNGRIIADSGEGYRDKHDCLHGIEIVKNLKDAPVKEGH